MSGNESLGRRERDRLAGAMLALVAGFCLVIATGPPPSVGDDGHVVLASGPVAAGASGDAGAETAAHRPAPGTGGLRSSPHAPRGARQAAPRVASTSVKPGARRDYLLRSAAAAHRGTWIWSSEASTPEFS